MGSWHSLSILNLISIDDMRASHHPGSHHATASAIASSRLIVATAVLAEDVLEVTVSVVEAELGHPRLTVLVLPLYVALQVPATLFSFSVPTSVAVACELTAAKPVQ